MALGLYYSAFRLYRSAFGLYNLAFGLSDPVHPGESCLLEEIKYNKYNTGIQVQFMPKGDSKHNTNPMPMEAFNTFHPQGPEPNVSITITNAHGGI